MWTKFETNTSRSTLIITISFSTSPGLRRICKRNMENIWWLSLRRVNLFMGITGGFSLLTAESTTNHKEERKRPKQTSRPFCDCNMSTLRSRWHLWMSISSLPMHEKYPDAQCENKAFEATSCFRTFLKHKRNLETSSSECVSRCKGQKCKKQEKEARIWGNCQESRV